MIASLLSSPPYITFPSPLALNIFLNCLPSMSLLLLFPFPISALCHNTSNRYVCPPKRQCKRVNHLRTHAHLWRQYFALSPTFSGSDNVNPLWVLCLFRPLCLPAFLCVAATAAAAAAAATKTTTALSVQLICVSTVCVCVLLPLPLPSQPCTCQYVHTHPSARLLHLRVTAF